MKTIADLLAGLGRPFLSRFQVTKVILNRRIVFVQPTHTQKPVETAMLLAALGLPGAALWESKKPGSRPPSPWVRFSPACFALPAAGQQWSVSRFGSAGGYGESKSGLGGPMTGLLLAAAAGLMVAAEADWRQREGA